MSTIKTKTFSGICPKSKTEKNISVDYIVSRSLDKGTTLFKSHYSCEDKFCTNDNCPIYKDAPQTIQGI